MKKRVFVPEHFKVVSSTVLVAFLPCGCVVERKCGSGSGGIINNRLHPILVIIKYNTYKAKWHLKRAIIA